MKFMRAMLIVLMSAAVANIALAQGGYGNGPPHVKKKPHPAVVAPMKTVKPVTSVAGKPAHPSR